MAVTIDRGACCRCGCCVDVCASRALLEVGGEVRVSEEACIDCGLCVKECPNEAIRPIPDSPRPLGTRGVSAGFG